MTAAKEPTQPVQVPVGEMWLAWGALVVLAVVSHPAHPDPSRTSFAAMAVAFGLGALVLSTRNGGTRITVGLGRLLSDVRGQRSRLWPPHLHAVVASGTRSVREETSILLWLLIR